jgi:hypothetical protein
MAKTVTKYLAEDGKEFDTAGEADHHDDDLTLERLVGLDKPQIVGAITNSHPDIRKAVCALYGSIQKARKDAGEIRPRKKAEPPATPPAAPAPPSSQRGKKA